MRKPLAVLILMALAASVFAAGSPDGELTKVTVLKTGDDKYDILGVPYMTRWGSALLAARDLNVDLEILEIGNVDAGNFNMDLLIASGDAPDWYQHGSAADVSRYAQPGFAVDLSEHVDLSMFSSTALDRHRIDGGVYGLPEPLATLALSINMDMASEAGWRYPGPDWTLDDMRELCRAIKAEGNGYCWGLFASRGGDWRQLLLQTSLGMVYYEGGDHTRTNIGVEFFELLEELKQWSPPHAEGLIDDSIIERHSTIGHPEQVAIFPTFPGHNKSFMMAGWAVGPEHVDDQWSQQKFVPWPRTGPVTQLRPTIVTSGSHMAVASGDAKRDALVAQLIVLANDCQYSASQILIDGKAAIRDDCPVINADSIPLSIRSEWTDAASANWDQRFRWAQEVAAIAAQHGSYDYGVGLPTSGALRDLWPIFQRQFIGELTPEETHELYVEKANEILAANSK
jgi:ABC-type glycerol-3-phosphate transport system substrate-binding protein